MKRQNYKFPAILNVILFLGVVAANFFASTGKINGKATGDISDQYPNLFTPAGITFSIWSVIYFFLAGFVVYQLTVLFSKKGPVEKILAITPLFVINCLANIAWLFAWHNNAILVSVIIMVVILATLVIITRRLRLPLAKKPLAEKLWLDIPFSIYMGWISVAISANITVLLVSLNWDGGPLSALTWTIILLIISSLLVLMMIRRSNYFYAVAVIWGMFGILLKRKTAGSTNDGSLELWATVLIVFLAIFFIAKLVHQSFKSRRALHHGTNNLNLKQE